MLSAVSSTDGSSYTDSTPQSPISLPVVKVERALAIAIALAHDVDIIAFRSELSAEASNSTAIGNSNVNQIILSSSSTTSPIIIKSQPQL